LLPLYTLKPQPAYLPLAALCAALPSPRPTFSAVKHAPFSYTSAPSFSFLCSIYLVGRYACICLCGHRSRPLASSLLDLSLPPSSSSYFAATIQSLLLRVLCAATPLFFTRHPRAHIVGKLQSCCSTLQLSYGAGLHRQGPFNTFLFNNLHFQIILGALFAFHLLSATSFCSGVYITASLNFNSNS
jgi:hypothetical protein